MPDFLSLNKLYDLLPDSHSAEKKADIGHFDILKVEDFVSDGKPAHTSYSRRSFFKASLIQGDCVVHYADQSITVKKYGLVFTNPSVPYKWEILNREQYGFICVFTEDFFIAPPPIKDCQVFQSAANAVILLDQESFEKFSVIFRKMEIELRSNYNHKYDYLRTLFMQVVHEAQKMVPEKGIKVISSNAAERLALLFNDLLDRQFSIKDVNDTALLKLPSDFSKSLNVHVNHLNKALKTATGHTTSQLIKKRILTEAKVLLKTTTWTITQISHCLGFEEPNHFSLFFKENMSVTASDFRNGN
ncbi:helix-turn-helix domain-containing protein [Flavobacterium notoginsengisoli]|uniref:helix-turn-helix domain-containing protein n=1 Tax=Flavobacterium notoginsengisoli TaxID=1478199 RepID=UPI0036324533